MREAIRDIDRLRHIDECIGHINDYLSGRSFEDMKADMMCYHAVVYNIMIIGEAANLLTKDFRDSHPEVPWRDIVDMRNALVKCVNEIMKKSQRNGMAVIRTFQ